MSVEQNTAVTNEAEEILLRRVEVQEKETEEDKIEAFERMANEKLSRMDMAIEKITSIKAEILEMKNQFEALLSKASGTIESAKGIKASIEKVESSINSKLTALQVSENKLENATVNADTFAKQIDRQILEVKKLCDSAENSSKKLSDAKSESEKFVDKVKSETARYAESVKTDIKKHIENAMSETGYRLSSTRKETEDFLKDVLVAIETMKSTEKTMSDKIIEARSVIDISDSVKSDIEYMIKKAEEKEKARQEELPECNEESGKAKIDKAGICFVYFSPVFRNAIRKNAGEYELTISPDEDIFIERKADAFFNVKGKEGTVFSWKASVG